jgi:hypothetical protein
MGGDSGESFWIFFSVIVVTPPMVVNPKIRDSVKVPPMKRVFTIRALCGLVTPGVTPGWLEGSTKAQKP